MKFLVTGGAGFIGSHLIEELLKKKHQIICVDDLSTGNLENLPKDKSLKVIIKKVQDLSLNDVQSCNLNGIFHLAAQVSVPVSIENFYESSSNNILSMLKVWDIAKHLKLPVIYASSSAVYGNTSIGDDQKSNYNILSPYALDKLTMEKYSKLFFKLYEIPSIGLRFFNVYGPRQDPSNSYSGVISIFIERLMKGEPVTLNGGFQTRDFIYVEDIARTLLTSMYHILKYPINDNINVGTGNSITIKKLLYTIATILDVKPEIIQKKLPEGDPKISIGAYQKINDILLLNTSDFEKVKNGLIKTMKYISRNFN